MNKLTIFIVILLIFFNISLFADIDKMSIDDFDLYYDLEDFNNLNFKSNLFTENNSFDFNSYLLNDFKIESAVKLEYLEYFNDLENFRIEKKQENLLRRSEIIFFGSLTFAAFGGWFFLSVFNVLIFEEPFGKLRQEQFVPLFVGSSLISISIVLSDLFINIKPKLKKVQIY
jgi:hypothetical protein